jgi:hypothetical protein
MIGLSLKGHIYLAKTGIVSSLYTTLYLEIEPDGQSLNVYL